MQNLPPTSEDLVPQMPLKTIISPYSEHSSTVQSQIISKNLEVHIKQQSQTFDFLPVIFTGNTILSITTEPASSTV